MSFRIAGVGTAVPREMITQDDAAQLAIDLAGNGKEVAATVQTLYRRAGVRKRHSALILSSTNGRPATQSFFRPATNSQDRGPTTGDRMRCYEDSALELAARAANAALCESQTPPNEIDHLVTVSCTGFQRQASMLGWLNALDWIAASLEHTSVLWAAMVRSTGCALPLRSVNRRHRAKYCCAASSFVAFTISMRQTRSRSLPTLCSAMAQRPSLALAMRRQRIAGGSSISSRMCFQTPRTSWRGASATMALICGFRRVFQASSKKQCDPG